MLKMQFILRKVDAAGNQGKEDHALEEKREMLNLTRRML